MYCFVATGVMPGEYWISAEHSTWNLIGPSDGIGVKLGWQSVVLEETFSVEGRHFLNFSDEKTSGNDLGFRISGSVKWKDTPMKDIQLTLLHHPGASVMTNSLLAFDKSSAGDEGEEQEKPTFGTRLTDAAGMFTFETVPCGRYMLVSR